jgi:predicted phosphoribosyltransferase
MVRRLQPRSVTLAVPVSPWDSVLTVEDYFDEIHVLYVQEFPPFAVASFYEDFHDLSDNEVLETLGRDRPDGTSERKTNR